MSLLGTPVGQKRDVYYSSTVPVRRSFVEAPEQSHRVKVDRTKSDLFISTTKRMQLSNYVCTYVVITVVQVGGMILNKTEVQYIISVFRPRAELI
jgi:hypothetical protein